MSGVIVTGCRVSRHAFCGYETESCSGETDSSRPPLAGDHQIVVQDGLIHLVIGGDAAKGRKPSFR